MKKVYLILQNGKVFVGRAFGAEGRVCGEVVFTTGVTGYLQSLTDPSYYGQILVQTFPLIGNYGVVPQEFESTKPYVSAYVVRECCEDPSNYRCEGKLEDWMRDNGVIGVCGIDTRAVAAIIREEGVMNAVVTDELPEDPNALFDELSSYKVSRSAVEEVSTTESYTIIAPNAKKNVAVYDFGVKKSLLAGLRDLGCNITVLPYNTPADEVLCAGFDGVVLSSGPANASDMPKLCSEISKLVGKLPILGVGLGHRLLALAQGAKTVRLKFGHHGANQPVRDEAAEHCCTTSQNHIEAVEASTLPAYANVSFTNINDASVEGIDYEGKKALGCEFDPQCDGPKGHRDLLCDFVSLIEEGE